ncbi:RES domain-containing protein [Nitrospirillum amazonense]|uniref:RES domain-containing protein n=1 Tax=Nitrospirillum amazonense TaxID=28077 RepID=A0A560FP71_9PROT|nr:HEPN-associated N-terminal domain-containing protein [Nitrospirillum amazonense]TWB23423.1 RES domain-containing protein [Nitrospirillum amazonense]
MGRAKEWQLEQYERGYSAVAGDICASCVTDPVLKQWVTNNSESYRCSFCGEESAEPIAASFDAFIGIVLIGIKFDWNNPDDEGIAYESAEGGYQASISDTWDVLSDYDISENSDVIDAIISAVGHNGWVDREYYIGDKSQRLSWGWDQFKHVVKHQTRYVFLTPDDSDDMTEVPPSQMLAAIGETVVNELADLNLITAIISDTDLIRIRIGKTPYTTSAEIGTPPPEFAIQSNRMSPAGIPMFYGAFDLDTARVETFDAATHAGQVISIGTFRPTRDLRMLDLADLPAIPSVFEEDGHHRIHPLRFLHAFASDIARPITRDGREHIEYVPTQIVTEYFRRVFRDSNGNPIDGIIYTSSRRADGRAFVLFCENEQCSESTEYSGIAEKLVRLITVEHERT